MRRLGCFIFALCVGCVSQVSGPTRTFTINLTAENPDGLYVLVLCDEEATTIEENVTVDLNGHSLRVDRAFLKNAQLDFRCRGRVIENGHLSEMANADSMHYWMIRRETKEVWYYIGTRQQYAVLDRGVVHQVGERTFQF
jgi:hypothetical protein